MFGTIFQAEPLDLVRGMLIGAAVMDTLRGIMHSWFVRHAATNIFKGIPTTPPNIDADNNFMTVMAAFGYSNFQTGALNLSIALFAPHLAAPALVIFPSCLALAMVGLYMPWNEYQDSPAEKNGKYMMGGYLTVCFLTGTFYLIDPSLVGTWFFYYAVPIICISMGLFFRGVNRVKTKTRSE